MPDRGRLLWAAVVLLLAHAGCAYWQTSTRRQAWIHTVNRWNAALDTCNAAAGRDPFGAALVYRSLRDSSVAAIDSLNGEPPEIRRACSPPLADFLQRARYNLLATELFRIDTARRDLAGLSGRADSLEESGDFAAAGQTRTGVERGTDSLGLAVETLLAEDLRAASSVPTPPRVTPEAGSGGSTFAGSDSASASSADPAEVRSRLRRSVEAARRVEAASLEQRPGRVRRGWVHRANALIAEQNAAVRADSAGEHQRALRELSAVYNRATAALHELAADTTYWPGRFSPPGPQAREELSAAPKDPESAIRYVLGLVNVNSSAIRHGLAVDRYREISRRQAFGKAQPRADAARLDSVLADPGLDRDLRAKILELRRDLLGPPGPGPPASPGLFPPPAPRIIRRNLRRDT